MQESETDIPDLVEKNQEKLLLSKSKGDYEADKKRSSSHGQLVLIQTSMLFFTKPKQYNVSRCFFLSI